MTVNACTFPPLVLYTAGGGIVLLLIARGLHRAWQSLRCTLWRPRQARSLTDAEIGAAIKDALDVTYADDPIARARDLP